MLKINLDDFLSKVQSIFWKLKNLIPTCKNLIFSLKEVLMGIPWTSSDGLEPAISSLAGRPSNMREDLTTTWFPRKLNLIYIYIYIYIYRIGSAERVGVEMGYLAMLPCTSKSY